jgi:hypothetical protein
MAEAAYAELEIPGHCNCTSAPSGLSKAQPLNIRNNGTCPWRGRSPAGVGYPPVRNNAWAAATRRANVTRPVTHDIVVAKTPTKIE